MERAEKRRTAGQGLDAGFLQRKHRRSAKLCIAWICLMLVLFVGLDRAQAVSPTETLRAHINRAIAVLDEYKGKGKSARAEEMDKLRAIGDDLFDFVELSKLSLGLGWKNMNESQRQEFVALFTKLLEQVYADRVLSYTDQKVLYQGETTLSANKVEVKTEIVGKDTRTPVLYRMRQEKDKWKVYDVVIEGVSLVGNYRTQFREILAQKSVDELLQTLKDKVQGY
jgi:phospholipid transport system substrate-binding protein